MTAGVEPAGLAGRYRSSVNLPMPGEWKLTAADRHSSNEEPVGTLVVPISP